MCGRLHQRCYLSVLGLLGYESLIPVRQGVVLLDFEDRSSSEVARR